MTDTERLNHLADLIAKHGEITLRRDRWEEGTALTVMDDRGWCLLGSEPMSTTHDALRAALDPAPPAPEATNDGK